MTKMTFEEDCISRRDAINLFAHWAREGQGSLEDALMELPPVQPKPKTEDILDMISAEIENYKLSEDELSDADEDSVKWGIKIAYDIVDKYKASPTSCSTCILDRTDACTRGAGRAIDDDACEDYVDGKQEDEG